jgi:hypothetical protein
MRRIQGSQVLPLPWTAILCQSDKGCYYSTSEAINLFIIRYTIRGIHILDLSMTHLLILFFLALSSEFNLEKHRNKHIDIINY